MIFGSSNDTPAAPAPAAAPVAQAAPAPAPQQPQVCTMELQDFIKCTQTQSDVTLCSGFNEVLKECKQKAQMSN